MRRQDSFAPINLLATLSIFYLCGCAGRDFVRPDPASFTLGRTAQQEILSRMGTPYSSGTLEKNGVTMDTVSYAYANSGGRALYPGVIAARAQGFYFQSGTLVGAEFSSSFEKDGTDFDETKVNQLKKGTSTRADAIRLFGTPDGEYVAPLVADPKDRGLVYLYVQTKGSAFNLRIYKKSLIVTCDENGLITGVEYLATGTKD